MEIFSQTFDTSFALSSMFLWIVFGFMAVTLNCDLQKLLRNNPFVLHLFGLLAFFFLFTLLDANNEKHVAVVWLKTFVIYILFVLMTKSKWYFVVPVLGLLLVDQTLKKQASFKKDPKYYEFQKRYSDIINKVVIVVIIVGCLQYMWLQKQQHKNKFSFRKFFETSMACVNGK